MQHFNYKISIHHLCVMATFFEIYGSKQLLITCLAVDVLLKKDCIFVSVGNFPPSTD